jgi:hypothetical protein
MFTHAEKTKKSHTVADAVKAAEYILTTKRVRQLNTKCIGGRSLDEAITLAEVNMLTDALVDDTLTYA